MSLITQEFPSRPSQRRLWPSSIPFQKKIYPNRICLWRNFIHPERYLHQQNVSQMTAVTKADNWELLKEENAKNTSHLPSVVTEPFQKLSYCLEIFSSAMISSFPQSKFFQLSFREYWISHCPFFVLPKNRKQRLKLVHLDVNLC
ncbi:hypothetical protein TNCT_688941 [Trichonephila clavata]|uniref:Uncharacterized protein n=1 Tax=Trichonephila clavata TaxID=2740835 RepID=A0A8X6KJY4_TRICU|nr:hypothetical protein TNCT_688941 [Trichonephila clavata]